jgi:hypothetical protein
MEAEMVVGPYFSFFNDETPMTNEIQNSMTENRPAGSFGFPHLVILRY